MWDILINRLTDIPFHLFISFS